MAGGLSNLRYLSRRPGIVGPMVQFIDKYKWTVEPLKWCGFHNTGLNTFPWDCCHSCPAPDTLDSAHILGWYPSSMATLYCISNMSILILIWEVFNVKFNYIYSKQNDQQRLKWLHIQEFRPLLYPLKFHSAIQTFFNCFQTIHCG